MEPPVPALPPRLVLYDGECGFCDRAVQWLLRVDREGRYRFAPLQGPAGAGVRRRHPELPADLDSIILVESTAAGERLYWRAEAMFRICADLRSPWRMLSWLGWLPPGLADRGYRLFARNRHRVFGRLETCRVPSPAERDRFLP